MWGCIQTAFLAIRRVDSPYGSLSGILPDAMGASGLKDGVMHLFYDNG